MDNDITLQTITHDNWREVSALKVYEEQQDFVAEPCYYLCLCFYGKEWHPLAIHNGDILVGFMMWTIDPEDHRCWLGGITIDKHHQRKGYGRKAIIAAMDKLNGEQNPQGFALSYSSNNNAKTLYHSLGFKEAGKNEYGEIIAHAPCP